MYLIFTQFLARDSAEASAEASVDLAEASVSAESRFTPIRSFTSWDRIKTVIFDQNLPIFMSFLARDSAEASAEASVELAEASGFGRTQF